jgi:ATP-binding protein involved in chromosome partitioning
MMGNMIQPVDIHGVKVMSLGFLLGESPAVLRGPIVSGYIQQILRQTDWGRLDYLIIDMPPGTGDIQLTIVQLAALDGAIIVTTPQALSLVDVAKGILMFEKVHVPVLGIVENMCSYQCDGCGKLHYPFGRSGGTLQRRFGLATLAELPILPAVSEVAGLDAGAGVEALRLLAENVHRAIGKQRIESPQRPQLTPLDGRVHIRWSDGSESTLSNYHVRCACPCAVCVDEMTGRPLLDPVRVPGDVRVEALQTCGNYAVAFSWSDGHTTGIYSWDYLKVLTQRPDLTAAPH